MKSRLLLFCLSFLDVRPRQDAPASLAQADTLVLEDSEVVVWFLAALSKEMT
jgi:hypothetical protein